MQNLFSEKNNLENATSNVFGFQNASSKDNMFFQNIKANANNWNYSSTEPRHQPLIDPYFTNLNTTPELERRTSNDSSLSSSQNTVNSRHTPQSQQVFFPNSTGSQSQKKSANKKKRNRDDNPDLLADDYSRSKKMVHEGFRSLTLRDPAQNSSSMMFPMNPPTIDTMMNSVFNINGDLSPERLEFTKQTSVESEYSLRTEHDKPDSDEEDDILHPRMRNRTSPPFQQNQLMATRRNSNTPTTTPLSRDAKKYFEDINKQTIGPENKVELEKELYSILKNGKRQYSNPVDFYVDELIRKSRRTDSTMFHSPADYIDDGFVNAVLGPQPTTDHALSLFVQPQSTAEQIEASASPFPMNGDQRSSDSRMDDGADPPEDELLYDDLSPWERQQRANNKRKNRPLVKGDVTHSDWIIEELEPIDANQNTKNSSTNDSPPNTYPALSSYHTYPSFPQRISLKRETTDSVNSQSRNYGGSSQGGTFEENETEGNESDMACCDDWSNNLSSNADEDDEDLHYPEGFHPNTYQDKLTQENLYQHQQQQQLHSPYVSSKRSPIPFGSHGKSQMKNPKYLKGFNNLQNQSQPFHRLHSDSSNHSMTMDSDDGEPVRHHLENDSFPIQQNHMTFFTNNQQQSNNYSNLKNSFINPFTNPSNNNNMNNNSSQPFNHNDNVSNTSRLNGQSQILSSPLFHSVCDDRDGGEDDDEDVINVGVF